ncbi:MAG: type II secretion system major pseudopilin GspG [Sulfuricurvum sp.]|uniref:type II secretion system major pseudopilin GspG n=1 Tax=Sulfuricurvum sp. TaxID=2025608 RepID=UPI002615B865|nr:type II secretion system major pseudopilin GspG [Sulfuricurvum sp.]MDD3597315.1 type II secretion system major pseudopilin GspG [Sulfuricurvum sp.]MDD4883127.1 type II secretion system major pseudopilin GspG [Sulfuricurvum sp.]
MLKRSGFTLIELLVVIVIIGLLASLVAPKFFGKLETAKGKTAIAQIQMLSTALDSFKLDTNRYPTTEEGLAILWANSVSVDGASGPYLPKPVEKDPWGFPYQYKAPGSDNHPYDLRSLGADGQEGGDGENQDVSVWK